MEVDHLPSLLALSAMETFRVLCLLQETTSSLNFIPNADMTTLKHQSILKKPKVSSLFCFGLYSLLLFFTLVESSGQHLPF